MTLELSRDESEMVRDLLNWRIDALGPEIHHTDSPEYRHRLEVLRDRLTDLRKRLEDADLLTPA